jgi:hypothetical protein
MRPVIGFELGDPGPTPDELVDLLVHVLQREGFAAGQVQLTLLDTQEKLAGYQEGLMVMYRKPMRRKDGVHRFWNRKTQRMEEAQQEQLFPE